MSNSIEQNLVLIDNFTMPLTNIVINMEKGKEKAKNLSEKIQDVGTNFGKVGKTMTNSFTKPLVSCFNAASSMSTTIQKVDSVFGKNSEEVKKWSATTLNKFGLAKSTSLEMAASFGEMAKGMGVGEDKASEMSRMLVGLSGDLASLNGVSVEAASKTLQGALSGQADALKSLGVSMDDNVLKQYALSNGYTSIYDDMTQAEKAQLRYNYILEKSKSAQGNFAINSGNLTNQQQLYNEGIKEVTIAIGQKLLPIGLKFLTFANQLISKFMGLSSGQQDFIIKVAAMVGAIGPAFNIIGKLSSGIGKAVSAYAKIGGAIKKAGSVMGLFTSPAGIAIAIIAAIAVGAFLIIKNWDKVKSFFNKFGNFLKGVFVGAGGSVSKFAETFKAIKSNIAGSISGLKTIFGQIIKILQPIITFIINKFINVIKARITNMSYIVTASISSLGGLFSGLTGILKGVITFIEGVFTLNFGKAFGGIVDIIKNITLTLFSVLKFPINIVIGNINKMINGINSLSFSVPDWVPILGGKGFSINIPPIPMLAQGTSNWTGGLAVTQERGGEIMDLPRGTRVYPHDKTVQMAYADGQKSSSKSILINKLADKIEVRSQGDIDAIVEKLAYRLEKIINNGGGEVYA